MFRTRQALVPRQQRTRLLRSSTIASIPRATGHSAIQTPLQIAAGQITLCLKALAGLSTRLLAGEVLLARAAMGAAVRSAAAAAGVGSEASPAAIRLEVSPVAIPSEVFLAAMAGVAEAVDPSTVD